jgi:hypothetical protein
MKYVDADWNILEETEIGGGLEKGRVAYWYSYDRDNMGNDLPHKHARVVSSICLVIGLLPIPNPANKTYVVFRRYVYLKYFSFCTN